MNLEPPSSSLSYEARLAMDRLLKAQSELQSIIIRSKVPMMSTYDDHLQFNNNHNDHNAVLPYSGWRENVAKSLRKENVAPYQIKKKESHYKHIRKRAAISSYRSMSRPTPVEQLQLPSVVQISGHMLYFVWAGGSSMYPDNASTSRKNCFIFISFSNNGVPSVHITFTSTVKHYWEQDLLLDSQFQRLLEIAKRDPSEYNKLAVRKVQKARSNNGSRSIFVIEQSNQQGKRKNVNDFMTDTKRPGPGIKNDPTIPNWLITSLLRAASCKSSRLASKLQETQGSIENFNLGIFQAPKFANKLPLSNGQSLSGLTLRDIFSDRCLLSLHIACVSNEPPILEMTLPTNLVQSQPKKLSRQISLE